MDPEAESLEAEVRELLTNYRNARRSSYEPCSAENLTKCLAGLQEELNLLSLKYIFNPYTDVCESTHTLRPHALISLVNAIYTLLHEHKRLTESSTALAVYNHELEMKNAVLNTKIERLTTQLASAEREARASIAEGLRSAERASTAYEELRRARARITQLSTRAAATEHAMKVKTTRAERDKQQLQDKFRDKCGTFLSTSEARIGALGDALEREQTHKDVIKKLDRNNRELVQEVLALKQDLLSEALDRVNLK